MVYLTTTDTLNDVPMRGDIRGGSAEADTDRVSGAPGVQTREPMDKAPASNRPSPAQEALPGSAPVVFIPEGAVPSGHREIAVHELARRIATLRGTRLVSLADVVDRGVRGFAVPVATLIGAYPAGQIGVESERDLFGGLVPYPVQAGKAISHSLINEDALRPKGWVPLFGIAVGNAVLDGFSVFDPGSALHAGRTLLKAGPCRLKPAWTDGGREQSVIGDLRSLEHALGQLDPQQLSVHGAVLEQDLSEAVVFSVGRVRIGETVLSYFGQQTATTDNSGASAYGGSRLTVVRGGFDKLFELNPDDLTRRAVMCAQTYDEAAIRHFPGLIASRRNYDVIAGRDARGASRIGVLEQSWRIGGASGAEIAAFEAFAADPSRALVKSFCVERYGRTAEPLADGFIYFQGEDPEVGSLTKYAGIETSIHAP
ncbi:hypothetical protein J2X65_004006 [Ancylobacter sp. 3268]|uniref:DUF3182 family protein n=1 Tax=Ancylobacter sp. 3268 TaxID=2817752 RepID=UPI002864D067|nr:DUF3182 family protein [Ancylobacter sp. 3268]MDR6954630.1 hypothetical protein [Ancylobacter sp. 3268]